MVGNRICKQIKWKHDPENLAKWENAQTGFPWIDAAMTQLKEEGWMHHLARHAVACFLTRGDLFISWEEGARVFDRDLVDADWGYRPPRSFINTFAFTAHIHSPRNTIKKERT